MSQSIFKFLSCSPAFGCRRTLGRPVQIYSNNSNSRRSFRPLRSLPSSGNGGNNKLPPGGGGGSGGNGNGDNEDKHWPWQRILTLTLGAGIAFYLIDRKNTDFLLTENTPVSIIIPVLNESNSIAETIEYIKSLDPAPEEIVVADGGSTDSTPLLAKKAGAKVVKSKRGRGQQSNIGAKACRDDGILMFVHADSKPPKNAIALARAALADPRCVLGGFVPWIEYEGRVLLFPTFHNTISTYYPIIFAPLRFFKGLKCMFGDQSLFCRAKDFWRVGGYKRLPIMEDADLCVRMHEEGAKGKGGREVQLMALNRTSGRRIKAWGNLRSTQIQWRLSWAWWSGASPEELWELYDRLYTDAFR